MEALHNLMSYFLETTSNLTNSLKGLSDEQFNFKQSVEHWSINECIQHLVLVEKLLAKKFRSIMQQPSNAEQRMEIKITDSDFVKKVENAGKHVVIEKPFTATVSEAEELIKLAKEKNVILSVYHNRRYDSDFKTVQKVLTDGLLGAIVEAEFHYDRFDPALSYKTHKETPSKGVGSLYDLGSHLIDQSLQLFGMPEAVFADVAALRPNSKVGDYFDLKLFYPSHRVILKSSYYVREPLPGNIVHGTKGSFIKTKADVQEKELIAGKMPDSANWGTELDTDKGLLHTEKDGKLIKEYIPSLKGNYMTYYDGIYEAIRDKKSVPVYAEEGMNVIKIIEAALKSNLEKKVVKL